MTEPTLFRFMHPRRGRRRRHQRQAPGVHAVLREELPQRDAMVARLASEGLLRKASGASTDSGREFIPACRLNLRQQQDERSAPPHGNCGLLYGPEEAVASRQKGQKEAPGACRGS